MLGIMMEKYYIYHQVSMTVNTILIIVMLALYDTKNEMNYIERFIYVKQREENSL